MKTKIEKQNELIDAIIEWNSKGKQLGYSKAQELINEYERQVKLLAIPAVVGRSEQLKCRNVACNEMVSTDSEDVFCEKHKRKLGI